MSREGRQRTKTFTGCWTCRSRRVKCDEQKPSCQRCRQFRVPCEGYGVRLSWLAIEDQSSIQSSFEQDAMITQEQGTIMTQDRRRIPARRTSENFVARLAPRLSSPEIDAILERIDDCPVGYSRSEKGIFSVFAIQKVAPSRHHTPTNIVPKRLEAEPITSETCQPQGHLISSQPVSLSEDRLQVSRQLDQGPLDPIANVDTQNDDHRRRNPSVDADDTPINDGGWDGLSPVEALNVIPAANNQEQTNPRDAAYGPNAVVSHSSIQHQSSHLDVLKMPAAQKRLVHHWVTFTSAKLVLLDETDNPCRTMMLPMALKGLMSSSESSSSGIATFHAICACAAYNLFELGGRKSEEDRVLALRHDQEAIRHLRYNLAHADQHHDQTFAMAIMACITIEAISGNTCRWRTHVSGGLAYLSKLRSGGVDLEILSAFQAHMVSMAILCGCPVSSELKSFLQEAEGLELSFPYYGASSSFLKSQDRMNFLAMSSAPIDAHELDTLELQLYLDFPTFYRDAFPKTHATILHHMAQAFYYASLVFLQTSVRRAHVDTVQTLVENGVRQLEAIESVSKGSAGSVMMWPALILGTQCGSPGLQARMKAWFQAKQKLGFRNVVVLEELINAVWSNRARGDMDTSWHDLIVEEGFDVFRL